MSQLERIADLINGTVLKPFGFRIVRQASLDQVAARQVELVRAAEAPRDPNAHLVEVVNRIRELDLRHANSVGRLGTTLADLDQRIASRLDAMDARLATIGNQVASDIGARLEALSQRVTELAKPNRVEGPTTNVSSSADIGHPDLLHLQGAMLELLRMFKPSAVAGHGRIRVGNEHDGGYVMLDDLSGVKEVYSLGVGGDSSWDLALAERGLRIVQFDHSDLARPLSHPNVTFRPLRVTPTPGPSSITIGELRGVPPDTASSPESILKIDIEGDEWAVLEQTSIDDLSPFAQVICEFHDFDRIVDDAWRSRALAVMRKLTGRFAVIHVHGNNYRPFVTPANVPFPQVVEVTLVSRSRYETVPSDERFPTSFDRPNNPARPDMILGRLEF